jgi:AcrR family transcriptional regulator
MTYGKPSVDGRRTALLEAAKGVFLRYGFRKTSMDDVARAAGISRQGLYLHFATKDLLFAEVARAMIDRARVVLVRALADERLSEEARIVEAFVAVYEEAGGDAFADHMQELMAAASALLGSAVEDAEGEKRSQLTKALRTFGIAARWKSAGLSPSDLADVLLDVSHGIKARRATVEVYRARIAQAVKLVCRGGPAARDTR